MKAIIALAISLLFTGCFRSYDPMPTNNLPDTLQVGQSILSRDTTKQIDYPALNEDQILELARQMTLDVPEGTQLIGVRPVKNGVTLDAYKVPTGKNPEQFKVYLVTRSNKGVVSDWIDLGEFHTCEHQGPMRFGGNRFYTTDATVTFDDATHFTMHRAMTLTSLYLKDYTLTEAWRVEWENRYEISVDHSRGLFCYKGQQETLRVPNDIDDPIIDDYKSRDLTILQR